MIHDKTNLNCGGKIHRKCTGTWPLITSVLLYLIQHSFLLKFVKEKGGPCMRMDVKQIVCYHSNKV